MSSNGKISAASLQRKNKAELNKQLTDLKEELLNLRVQKVTGRNASRLSNINTTRKNIARTLTVLNLKQREAVLDLYKKKKYLPLDLRHKKTRALRRSLTKNEKSKKTVRQVKQEKSNPTRKFGIKA